MLAPNYYPNWLYSDCFLLSLKLQMTFFVFRHQFSDVIQSNIMHYDETRHLMKWKCNSLKVILRLKVPVVHIQLVDRYLDKLHICCNSQSMGASWNFQVVNIKRSHWWQIISTQILFAQANLVYVVLG